MKRIFYLLGAMVITCCSDDSQSESKNFTYSYYSDRSITVTNGFIAKCGEPDYDGIQEFKIRLAGPDIKAGEDGTLMGYGDSFFIYLDSESSTELLEGEYEIRAYKAGLLLNHNFDSDGGSGESIAADHGVVTVAKSEDNYTLTFNITLEDSSNEDQALKGTFKGKLKEMPSCAALY